MGPRSATRSLIPLGEIFMNEKDVVFNAFKETLILFALLSGVGALVAGKYLSAVIILSMAALLYFERPFSEWRKKTLGW